MKLPAAWRRLVRVALHHLAGAVLLVISSVGIATHYSVGSPVMKVQVYDLMVRDVLVASADDPVAHVRDLMAQRKVLAIPVAGHDNEPAGIVTSTDLVLELDPDTSVSEVMTSAVCTVSPHADISEASRMML